MTLGETSVHDGRPEQSKTSKSPKRFLFAVTIFWSAFLLFQVELIIGKFLLPWFGGASSVWATALVFFQLLLLAGYAYSHFLPRVLGTRRHAIFHTALAVISAVVLLGIGTVWNSPITPGESWKPQPGSNPILGVLSLLCISVGIPFMVLSTTGPLLQKWYSLQSGSKDVYRLYAVSNAGSLLGLLSYPLLIEPFLRIRSQGWAWAIMYVLFAAGVLFSAASLKRDSAESNSEPEPSAPDTPETKDASPFLWLILAALSSMLLLGVTNVICSEVAVVPLLWVFPLSIYLLSWIVTFGRRNIYSRNKFFPILAVALVLGYTTLTAPGLKIQWQVLVFGLVQLIASIVCHGELRKAQPATHALTLYYLIIATGSALGGLFVILVAPHIFHSYLEFPLALFLIALVMAPTLLRDPHSWVRRGPAWLPFAMGLALIVLLALMRQFAAFPLRVSPGKMWLMAAAAAAILALKLFRARSQTAPMWVMLLMIAVIGLWCGFVLRVHLVTDYRNLTATRNFYGVIRVRDVDVLDQYNQARNIEHGRTTHGVQLLNPKFRDVPTTYFGPNTGVGLLLASLPKDSPHRVGIVGLGAGTLAAYSRPGDHFTFYEINPAVIDIAAGKNPKFTFVSDAKGKVDTSLGDARLSLEDAVRSGGLAQFDVLVLDAFSGDSIPVHLLTVEAFKVYLQLLKPDGVIAVHISNRNVDLESPVAELCRELKLDAVRVTNPPGEHKEYQAVWILVSPDHQRLLRSESIALNGFPITNTRHVRLWTDDYSNLVQILK